MEAIGEQLAGSLEIDARLQHVAEMLVPQFADHCFIDLFQGDALIRRVRRHAGGWTPPAGTWAQTGEQIQYPEGHFCQQAMARLETVIIADVTPREFKEFPAPSAPSKGLSRKMELTSILAAPLYTRGVLLGVISVARSGLTSRTQPHYTASDRDQFTIVARKIAAAIDSVTLTQPRPQPAAHPGGPQHPYATSYYQLG